MKSNKTQEQKDKQAHQDAGCDQPIIASPWLNTDQAATYLNLKNSTLEAWRTRGGGPAFSTFGRRAVRYHIDDLENFGRQSRALSTSERISG